MSECRARPAGSDFPMQAPLTAPTTEEEHREVHLDPGTPASAISLTLRAVGGLTTPEIASAFLAPEATMAQRISRAKASIKSSGVPFGLPAEAERAARLGQVLQVLYLIFNEGYTSSAGPGLQRVDLSDEAIRLARMLHGLLPADGEVTGLLALMLLTDARRAARVGPSGELIPLDEQDRTRWSQDLIAEGVALVSDALTRGKVGWYPLQAAIAAVHDEAARGGHRLEADSCAVRDAEGDVGQSHGDAQPCDRGGDGGGTVAKHYRLDAVRAHLLERAGDPERALAHYRAAAEGTASLPERNYLLTRAARLSEASRP